MPDFIAFSSPSNMADCLHDNFATDTIGPDKHSRSESAVNNSITRGENRMYSPNNNFINQQGSNDNTNGFEITKKPSGHFNLKVWGRFPPNWIANLSTGLASNRISINGGTAKKVKTLWQADFEIAATNTAINLNRIDFLAFAKNGADTDSPDNISLTEFSLGDPNKNDGALYLELKAVDQIGFLSSLLSRLAFYTLFPDAMVIETIDGRIYDRFWIKGVGGSIPSDTAIGTLKHKLEGYLVK